MRRSSMSMSVGLGSGSRSANAAAARMKMVHAIAAQNSGPNRGARLTGVTATSSLMLSSSVAMTDPGIEHRIEHVDNEIHQDGEGRESLDVAPRLAFIPAIAMLL